MIFLLDTNAFSDLMREHLKVDARLGSLSRPDQAIICPVVRGEILYGIARLPQGRRRQELEVKAAILFVDLPCEPIPALAAEYYASIKLARQRQGITLDENDLWIAATAPALDAVLVTRDGDFQMIEGLSVEDWTE